MTINQLRYFVAVAEHQSFTKAATQYYISQTAITQQVQALEDPASSQAKLFRALGELETLRKTHRAFSSQADLWTFDTGSDQVLGIVRSHQGQLLIGCFNFGESDYVLKKQSRTVRNLLTGEDYNRPITVPGFDFIWLSV